MSELRSSARLPLNCKVREANGDYIFSFQAANLSEDGIFLLNKICFHSQDHHSKLTFSLPNGGHLRNITARIVRENRKGEPKGCAYEFLNLSEEDRMELKRCMAAAEAS